MHSHECTMGKAHAHVGVGQSFPGNVIADAGAKLAAGGNAATVIPLHATVDTVPFPYAFTAVRGPPWLTYPVTTNKIK